MEKKNNYISFNNKINYWIILLLLFSLHISSCKSSKKNKKQKQRKEARVKQKPVSAGSGEVETVLQTAKSYIGTRYKFGGSSRSGMDCSGLVCVSFQSASVKLPRTSEEQSKTGTKVDLDEVIPGDLVFFTDRKGHKKVTHVGIVTNVRGKQDVRFIHSSTKLGVVEDNLYAEYYIKLFLKAVRIF